MEKFNTQEPRRSDIFRWATLTLITAVVLLSTACATLRFTYNHGDTLLYWWLNGYVDLDSEQTPEVKQDIDALFQWHRQTQLKEYAQLLATAQRQFARQPTRDELWQHYREVRQRGEQLANRAVPELAEFALSIKPEQITKLEKKFASNNEKFRKKFLKGDTADRQELRFDKSLEHFEVWFGHFSRDQKAALRKVSDARPLNNEALLEERMLRQRKIVTLLRRIQQEKPSKEVAMGWIRGLIKEVFARFESPERKAFYDANIEGSIQMILTATRLATPEQKAHLQKRMQGWINDFQALASQRQ